MEKMKMKMALAAMMATMAMAGCEASPGEAPRGQPLTKTERQMGRALIAVGRLYQTVNGYKGLTTQTMEKAAGGPISWEREDMEGISFAASQDEQRAVVSIKTAGCEGQLASMRDKLVKLALVEGPESVVCTGDSIVGTSVRN